MSTATSISIWPRRESTTTITGAATNKPASPLGQYQSTSNQGRKCNDHDRVAGGNRNVDHWDGRNNGDSVKEFPANNRYGNHHRGSSASISDHWQTNQSRPQQQYGRNNECNRQWSSCRTTVTTSDLRTPCRSGNNENSRFYSSFSFRQTRVPEGYPKMDHERNPRRGSCVSEFSRKLAEGYDIWEDSDRPIINWKYPQLPIRENRAHELRMMANLERIKKMRERETQMNKRNIRASSAVEKRETAWWERSKSGYRNAPSRARPSYVSMTPRNNRSLRPTSASNSNFRPNPMSSFSKPAGSIYMSASRR